MLSLLCDCYVPLKCQALSEMYGVTTQVTIMLSHLCENLRTNNSILCFRLYESHKRVQKVNQNLEDKLLKIVDKCETEKNSLTRDLTSLTQKLVEARGKIHRLQDENVGATVNDY